MHYLLLSPGFTLTPSTARHHVLHCPCSGGSSPPAWLGYRNVRGSIKISMCAGAHSAVTYAEH